MPNFFSNLFDKIKSGLNGFGENAKRVAGRVGSVINGIGSNVGKVWDFAKNIPILGDVIKRSPISGIVDTGLNIASGAGNLLSRLGEGNVGGALNAGLKTAQRVGLSKPMAGKIGRVGHGLINQIQAI